MYVCRRVDLHVCVCVYITCTCRERSVHAALHAYVSLSVGPGLAPSFCQPGAAARPGGGARFRSGGMRAPGAPRPRNPLTRPPEPHVTLGSHMSNIPSPKNEAAAETARRQWLERLWGSPPPHKPITSPLLWSLRDPPISKAPPIKQKHMHAGGPAPRRWIRSGAASRTRRRAVPDEVCAVTGGGHRRRFRTRTRREQRSRTRTARLLWGRVWQFRWGSLAPFSESEHAGARCLTRRPSS